MKKIEHYKNFDHWALFFVNKNNFEFSVFVPYATAIAILIAFHIDKPNIENNQIAVYNL